MSKAKKARRKNLGIKRIKKEQKQTDLCISNASFQKACKEITAEHGNYRWSSIAMGTLHHAVEDRLRKLFEDSLKAAIHAKRVTVKPDDLQHVQDSCQYAWSKK